MLVRLCSSATIESSSELDAGSRTMCVRSFNAPLVRPKLHLSHLRHGSSFLIEVVAQLEAVWLKKAARAFESPLVGHMHNGVHAALEQA